MIAPVSSLRLSFLQCLSVLIVSQLITGCGRPARQTIAAEEMEQFRGVAVKYLEDAAFGEDPALRMNALEAFEKVAPTEGLQRQCIPLNIENEYPGVSFSALMAVGRIHAKDLIDMVRTRAESPNPHVRMAAIYALHQLGDDSHTGELSHFLLQHPDARVRANAALVIGRMGPSESAVKMLKTALRREKKTAAKLQILESLAMMGDNYAENRLMFDGWSAVPEQSALAMMMLANARCDDAEDLFWNKLGAHDQPEVQLQAARGLARLGHKDVLSVALKRLNYDSQQRASAGETAEQRIERVRGLAAMALEDLADPAALAELKKAFEEQGQSAYVRLAVARAAIRTIDETRRITKGHAPEDSDKHRKPATVAAGSGEAEAR